MKVGFFSTDWAFKSVPGMTGVKRATYGGTYHYRMALPAEELAKHGYDTLLSWAWRPGPDGRIEVMDTNNEWITDCDVVVFQRWMGVDADRYVRSARAAGQVILNEIDDHYWAIPKGSVAYEASDPKLHPDFNRDHYRKMIDASNGVICSTPTLARCLGTRVPTYLCRNAIDIERWNVRDPGRDGMIGWVGGIPWRSNDLGMLRDSLTPFLHEYGLPFYHGGSSEDPSFPKAWEQLGLDTKRIQVAHNPLSNIDDYPALWEPINLCVIPLQDSLFYRSKSWLKGLEASARGIPFIASKLPEYEALGVGRLAKTPREWRRHLEDLLDPEVRRAEGAANRKRAEELSIANQWHQWDAVLREVTSTQVAA